MKKPILILLTLALLTAAGAGGYLYVYGHADLTGLPYEEIAAYRHKHPRRTVTYAVPIDDRLTLTDTDTAVTLTDARQGSGLTANAEYLQGLTAIDFGSTVPTPAQVQAVKTAFPNAKVTFGQVELFGQRVSVQETELHLSHGQTAEAAQALAVLPSVTDVYLSEDIPLEDAAALCTAHPSLTYHYTVTLFGQTLTTDMETVSYFRVPIGDEGLEQFRKLLPMMHKLTCLTLDWCGTSDEAMAALRQEFSGRFRVEWRIFFGEYNCLTDTYKIWANYLTTEQAYPLRYCTEVKYMDIGHSQTLEHIDFAAYMPNLEVLILGDCRAIQSLEPLRGCTKMEYLEMYRLPVSDLSPLSGMTELEHLNISEMPITDISPLEGLPKLKRLWSNNNPALAQQVLDYGKRHTDCTVLTNGGHPVFYHWRYTDPGQSTYTPRYALLRQQIGYPTSDSSCWPKGYVREEITYESTGITP